MNGVVVLANEWMDVSSWSRLFPSLISVCRKSEERLTPVWRVDLIGVHADATASLLF